MGQFSVENSSQTGSDLSGNQQRLSMPITQAFKPPFAPGDVDTLQLDFAPALGVGETLAAPAVTASGGFSFAAPLIGGVAPNGTFSSDPAGTIVQVMATAGTTPGAYQVTFTVSTSSGRALHRTVRCDIAARS